MGIKKKRQQTSKKPMRYSKTEAVVEDHEEIK